MTTQQVSELSAERLCGMIATALGLFASCIKSDEDWSPVCQKVQDDAFAALLALAAREAKAREELNAWQPIETAPKDGTPILIYVPSDDDGDVYKIARWHRDQLVRGHLLRGGWPYAGGWIADGHDGLAGWMPLPPAPPEEGGR